VAGQPGSVARCRAKKERVARLYAWAALTSARVGACGHAVRRLFARVSPVDLSHLPLHDGMYKNTFGEL
jgi:hypothetical protein